MKKYLPVIIIFYFALQVEAQTVSDIDNNTYNTVGIGTQTWMKENLKTTKYNDGTTIPEIKDSSIWIYLKTPAYCWNENKISNKTTYGALYNWYAINTGKLCPSGWHVPTETEWETLIAFLGGKEIAGGKLKESGTIHWASPNGGADNSSGFTALPSGFRDSDFYGTFHSPKIGMDGYWWADTDTATYYYLNSVNSRIFIDDNDNKSYGISVRCIKDGAVSYVPEIGGKDSNYLYPNPAKDKLYLNRLDDALVVISDLQGKHIIKIHSGTNPIDISGFKNGVYIVKIINSENILIGKFIKE